MVNYRKLNQITLPDSFPFPHIWEELRSIPQCKIFSQLYLKMGYHQVQIARESRKYTSFVITFGQYEYKRVPFVLTNATRVFQRIMREIIGHLPFIRVFLDGIVIFSLIEEEHFKHLQEIFEILKSSNIAINFEKSKFFKPKISFLGHIIDQEGIRPGLSRLKPPSDFKIPKTKRGIQQIIGYLNWYRPYVPNLSNRMKTITDRLKDNKTMIKWEPKDSMQLKSIYDQIQ